MTYFDYQGDGSAPGGEFLAQLSPEEWEWLLDVVERRRFETGAAVMRSGEPDRSVWVVVSGSVEVTFGHGRRERAVRTQGPGTILGEVAFFDGEPRSATVRALEPTQCLRLSLDAFEVLAARHPALGRTVVLELGRILARRLRQAEGRDGR